MKPFLRDYLLAVVWYMALLVPGLVITLTVSSAVGYLPYSDRPGPGWVGPSFSWGQVGYFASWSVLLLAPVAIYGTAVFGYLRLLSFLSAPQLLIRVLGAVAAGIVSFAVAAGAGWYIAMAAFPVWIAAGLGAVWGAVLLPRYLGSGGPKRAPWARWTAISVVLLMGPAALYRAFLVPSYGQRLQVNLVRVTPSAEPRPRGGSDLEPWETTLLDSLFPNGRWKQGLTGSSSTGDASHEARMLVVVTAPLTAEVRLRVPKGDSVIYVQRGDRWDMFPPGAPTLRERIRLGVGSNPNEATFAWPGSDPTRFTWERQQVGE